MNLAPGANAFAVQLHFHGDLSFFLRSSQARRQPIVKRLGKKTSVKDAIESCGVPHPEVDLIVTRGAPVGFSYQLVAEEEIDVYPVSAPLELFPGDRLQQRGLASFVADCHLGKLARHLRLLGLDVLYGNKSTDAELLVIARADDRALLTRDRRLLMHAAVRHGYCPRSHDADEQTIEVIRRFDLAERLAPYTRCLQCNGPLERVEKAEIFEQLEPLTKIYYHEFRRCLACSKIYWPGSHFGKLEARLEKIRFLVNRL